MLTESCQSKILSTHHSHTHSHCADRKLSVKDSVNTSHTPLCCYFVQVRLSQGAQPGTPAQKVADFTATPAGGWEGGWRGEGVSAILSQVRLSQGAQPGTPAHEVAYFTATPAGGGRGAGGGGGGGVCYFVPGKVQPGSSTRHSYT